MKVRLKMMFFDNHFADIGKKIKYSSKWMSQIGKDTGLMAIVEKLRCCPSCGWDMSEWFIKASKAVEEMMPIPEPEIPERKCPDCKNVIPPIIYEKQ